MCPENDWDGSLGVLRDPVQHFWEYIIDVVKRRSPQSKRDVSSLYRNKIFEKVKHDPNEKQTYRGDSVEDF